MAVLEPPGPLASSKLWTWQRDFYQREGVDAWGGKIPFLITSNPAIADSYAQIVVRLIQDHVRSGHAAAGEPFYVVELGAGHGAFSFHTLRRLTELRGALGLLDVPVVYVMTDFAARTIEHWRSHRGLAPFVAAGQLDFAAFRRQGVATRRIGDVPAFGGFDEHGFAPGHKKTRLKRVVG